MRHKHYALDVEAKKDLSNMRSLLQKPNDDWDSYSISGVDAYKSLPDDEILYLCLFTYTGGRMHGRGMVHENTRFTLEALDYLIDERKFMPAVFLKGFVLKYGSKPSNAPRLDEAHKLLQEAADAGIGSATHELRYFSRHRVLEDIKPVFEQL